MDLGLNCFQFYSANEKNSNSAFWTLYLITAIVTRKISAWKLVLNFTNRHSLEEREKRARSEGNFWTIWWNWQEGEKGKGQMKVPPLCYSQHPQETWCTWLQQMCLGPPQFATSCSYSATCHAPQESFWGEKNRKRQCFCRWMKRYNCFHKSQGFPGEGGYAGACTARLSLLEIKEFSIKGMLCLGQGTQSLNPATPSPPKYYRLSQEGWMEMVLSSRHVFVVNWTKNELSVRKRQKANEDKR